MNLDLSLWQALLVEHDLMLISINNEGQIVYANACFQRISFHSVSFFDWIDLGQQQVLAELKEQAHPQIISIDSNLPLIPSIHWKFTYHHQTQLWHGVGKLVQPSLQNFNDDSKDLFSLLHEAPLGFALSDIHGNLLEVNEEMSKLSGYSLTELLHGNIAMLTGTTIDPKLIQLLLKSGTYGPSKHILKDKNGESVYIKVYGKLFKNQQGEVRVLHMLRNITKNVTLQQQLDDKLQLLNETGSIAKIGGWKFLFKNRTVRWTDQVYYIFDLQLETHLSPNKILDMVDGEFKERLKQAVLYCIKEETPFSLILKIHTAMQRKLWINFVCKPIYENQQYIGVGGTIQDVTETENARIELLRKKQNLKEFALIQSHVIRHPVSNILGLIDLIENDPEQETEDLIKLIKQQTLSLDYIIQQMIARTKN
ncbi:MAG: PAS domain S-box protein [Bacteroidota bacterium]